MGAVRTVRQADLPALARLCRAAAGDHDYVLSFLDEMVRAREIRVATDGRRIVAMAGITECVDRALWLGQLRTHPQFRRRGYATRILDDAFGRVVREDRPALRLWASRRNHAARALFEGNGFLKVGSFTRVAAPPLAAEKGGPQPVGRHALGTRQAVVAPHAGGTLQPAGARFIWNRWRRSLANRDGRGYIGYRWHFVPLTPAVLVPMEKRQELYGSHRAAWVLWADPDDRALYGAVLAGGREALRMMRREAALRGRQRVELFLPMRSRLVRAARRAGFGPGEWGRAAILYERLNPSSSVRAKARAG